MPTTWLQQQLHIDNAHDLNTTASEKKEMDFFADCDNFDNDTAAVERNNNPSSGPKVDAELENVSKHSRHLRNGQQAAWYRFFCCISFACFVV